MKKKQKYKNKLKSRVNKNRNLYLRETEKEREESLSATKQQKFNFDRYLVEDELDTRYTNQRKKKQMKLPVVETKKHAKKSLIFLYLSLFLCLVNLLFFCFFNLKNQEQKEKYTAPENIVFLGDSITEFYDLKKYYPNHSIVNSGISGNKTTDILENLEERVYRYNPSKIFLMIGTNDLQESIKEEEIIDNIIKIIEKIQTNRKFAKIYVESIYPVNHNVENEISQNRKNESIQFINKKIESYCKKKKITYLNVYKELQDHDGNLKEIYTKDGLHLNQKGYTFLTKFLKPYVEEKVDET